jgi:DNA-3-methyladenine glycosylase II
VCKGAPFFTLARSIVGQQISVRAAATVWGRFESMLQAVTPGAVLDMPQADLLGCGLSRRKLETIIDLARHFESGTVDPARWPGLGDDAVIAELTAVRGIGRWTAEMFLIFCLLRPDVLPLADVGLQRAVALHYYAGRRIAPRTIARLGNSWSPWRSVATWYLWRSLDPEAVEY